MPRVPSWPHRVPSPEMPQGQRLADVGEHADLLDQVQLRLARQTCRRHVPGGVERGPLGAGSPGERPGAGEVVFGE